MNAENGRCRVLVVDDEERVARAHARILQKVAEVTWCTSFDGALELLESGRFSIVLSDLDLGGPSGLELLTIVARRWPNMHRYLCTGKPSRMIPPPPAPNTYEAILEKPVLPADLRRLVTSGGTRGE